LRTFAAGTQSNEGTNKSRRWVAEFQPTYTAFENAAKAGDQPTIETSVNGLTTIWQDTKAELSS
jgi:hypothetical protein